MESLRRNLIGCIGAAAAIALMAACSPNRNEEGRSNYSLIIDSDSLPQAVKNIVKAVYEDDPELFAQNVGYPLLRPYPLNDIRTPEDMKAYYGVLVDDSLRNVILNAAPEDWQKYGWRGYSLGDGSYIWVDESVYDINYVSKRERELIDSLTRIEKNSLPKELGTDWTPVITLKSEDGGTVYRIDEKSHISGEKSPEYRLSEYDNSNPGQNLLKKPERIIKGYMRIEGSAPVVSYVFTDPDSGSYAVYPDDPISGSPSITLPDNTDQRLEKAYWHELIR